MSMKACAMKSSWARVQRTRRTVVVLVCLWKLHSRLLRACRVRLPPWLFKGSANCTTFAVAHRLYLSKRNLFWGYLVSRGELCKLVHRSVSCLGVKPGSGFAFSLLLQALHPYGSKEQTFMAHTSNGCHLVFLIPPTCKFLQEWMRDSP